MINVFTRSNSKIATLLLVIVAALYIFKPMSASALTPGCYIYTSTPSNITATTDCGATPPASTAITDSKCYARPSLLSFSASSAFVEVTCGVLVFNGDGTNGGNNASGTAFVNPRADGNNDPATTCLTETGLCNINQYIELFINILSGLVGVVVVMVIVIGGIQYGTAGDDPGKLQAAKQRITKALIALLVFIFLYAFLQYLVPGGVI